MTIILETVQNLADQRLPYEVEPPSAADDAWVQFFAVCADIRTTYPQANLPRWLEADCQERDAVLRGACGER
jgi:hypothetical protein